MAGQSDFPAVFEALRQLLKPYEPYLVVAADTPDNYYLNTPHLIKKNYPLFFGAVQIKKGYVSFHLIPVYACPELSAGLSPALRARMQGKSCFNFKSVAPELFTELAGLIQTGFDQFKAKGWLEA